MKAEQQDPYQTGGLVLLLAAMLFLILAFLRAGWSIAPLLILSAMGLFLTGLLILTFSRGESPDPVVTGLAPVQHQINTALLLSRAGSRSPALIFPSPGQPGKVMQFHALPSGTTSHGDASGILLAPAGLPLLRELEGRFHLRIPSDPDRIPQLLQEVGEEMLAIAARVSTTPEAEGIRVDLEGFALYPGCRTVHETSPDACRLHPCAVCSLLACLVVRSTGKECHIRSVALDDRTETVRLEFSFRPPVPVEESPAIPAEPVSPLLQPVVPRVPSAELPPVSPEPAVPVAAIPPASPEPAVPVAAIPPASPPAGPGYPASGEPGPAIRAGPVSHHPGEAAAPRQRTPVTVTVEEPAPEVPAAWWIRHPGSGRIRYLRIDEVIPPVPAVAPPELAEMTPPVPAEVEPVHAASGLPVPAGTGSPAPMKEVTSSVPGEMMVPPVPAEREPPVPGDVVIRGAGPPGYLSMEELVARAMRDMKVPGQAGREEPPGEEPVSPRLKDPVVSSAEHLSPVASRDPAFPAPGGGESMGPEGRNVPATGEPVSPLREDLIPPGRQEPAVVVTTGEDSSVREEPGPAEPGRQEVPAGGGSASPVPVEPEDPVWWIRHPGSRRVRYLRGDEEVTPAGREPLPSNPGKPPAPGKESPEIRVLKEEPAGPPRKKSASSRSRKKTTGGRKKRKPPGS